MKNTLSTYNSVETGRRERIETTFRYMPLLGEVLGFWKKVNQSKVGTETYIEIQTPLEKWDRLYINGQEIKIPDNK